MSIGIEINWQTQQKQLIIGSQAVEDIISLIQKDHLQQQQKNCSHIGLNRTLIQKWEFYKDYVSFFSEIKITDFFKQNFLLTTQKSQKLNSKNDQLSFLLQQVDLKLIIQNSMHNLLKIKGFTIVKQYDYQRDDFQIEILKKLPNFQVIQIFCRYQTFSKRYLVYNDQHQSFRHQFYSVIGSGGFGKVFSCPYFGKNQIQPQYVIKCLKFTNEQDQLKIFIKEFFIADIMSSLQIGPKLCQLNGFQFVLFNDCLQFAMENCTKYRQKNLEIELKQNLLAMHLLKVVHSDIKPSNIMYSPSYQKNVFLDYGLSQLLAQNIGQKSMTQFKGTYEFCSEEMKKIFAKKKYQNIDLYNNDVNMLKKSLADIARLSKQQPDFPLFLDSYEGFSDEENLSQNFENELRMLFKYYLYTNQQNQQITSNFQLFIQNLLKIEDQQIKVRLIREGICFCSLLQYHSYQIIQQQIIWKEKYFKYLPIFKLNQINFQNQEICDHESNKLQYKSSLYRFDNLIAKQKKIRKDSITSDRDKVNIESSKKFTLQKADNLKYILQNQEQSLKFQYFQYLELFIQYTSFFGCQYNQIKIDLKEKCCQVFLNIVNRFAKDKKYLLEIQSFFHNKQNYSKNTSKQNYAILVLKDCYIFLINECLQYYNQDKKELNNQKQKQKFLDKYALNILKDCIILGIDVLKDVEQLYIKFFVHKYFMPLKINDQHDSDFKQQTINGHHRQKKQLQHEYMFITEAITETIELVYFLKQRYYIFDVAQGQQSLHSNHIHKLFYQKNLIQDMKGLMNKFKSEIQAIIEGKYNSLNQKFNKKIEILLDFSIIFNHMDVDLNDSIPFKQLNRIQRNYFLRVVQEIEDEFICNKKRFQKISKYERAIQLMNAQYLNRIDEFVSQTDQVMNFTQQNVFQKVKHSEGSPEYQNKNGISYSNNENIRSKLLSSNINSSSQSNVNVISSKQSKRNLITPKLITIRNTFKQSRIYKTMLKEQFDDKINCVQISELFFVDLRFQDAIKQLNKAQGKRILDLLTYENKIQILSNQNKTSVQKNSYHQLILARFKSLNANYPIIRQINPNVYQLKQLLMINEKYIAKMCQIYFQLFTVHIENKFLFRDFILTVLNIYFAIRQDFIRSNTKDNLIKKLTLLYNPSSLSLNNVSTLYILIFLHHVQPNMQKSVQQNNLKIQIQSIDYYKLMYQAFKIFNKLLKKYKRIKLSMNDSSVYGWGATHYKYFMFQQIMRHQSLIQKYWFNKKIKLKRKGKCHTLGDTLQYEFKNLCSMFVRTKKYNHLLDMIILFSKEICDRKQMYLLQSFNYCMQIMKKYSYMREQFPPFALKYLSQIEYKYLSNFQAIYLMPFYIHLINYKQFFLNNKHKFAQIMLKLYEMINKYPKISYSTTHLDQYKEQIFLQSLHLHELYASEINKKLIDRKQNILIRFLIKSILKRSEFYRQRVKYYLERYLVSERQDQLVKTLSKEETMFDFKNKSLIFDAIKYLKFNSSIRKKKIKYIENCLQFKTKQQKFQAAYEQFLGSPDQLVGKRKFFRKYKEKIKQEINQITRLWYALPKQIDDYLQSEYLIHQCQKQMIQIFDLHSINLFKDKPLKWYYNWRILKTENKQTSIQNIDQYFKKQNQSLGIFKRKSKAMQGRTYKQEIERKQSGLQKYCQLAQNKFSEQSRMEGYNKLKIIKTDLQINYNQFLKIKYFVNQIKATQQYKLQGEILKQIQDILQEQKSILLQEQKLKEEQQLSALNKKAFERQKHLNDIDQQYDYTTKISGNL